MAGRPYALFLEVRSVSSEAGPRQDQRIEVARPELTASRTRSKNYLSDWIFFYTVIHI